jgi:hypothetical protein
MHWCGVVFNVFFFLRLENKSESVTIRHRRCKLVCPPMNRKLAKSIFGEAGGHQASEGVNAVTKCGSGKKNAKERIALVIQRITGTIQKD